MDSSQNTESVDALNQLLQGEYMAVESFNTFIAKVDNEKVKKEFQEVQKQHRENIDKLAGYIQNIGGHPHENLGMKGTMADIKNNMDLGLKPNTWEVVSKAIEGETKGVNMAEKVLRGNLDDKSRDIAGEILNKDRASIKRLMKLTES